MRNQKKTKHYTFSDAVKGIYLSKHQGNQPVNHHNKCTLVIKLSYSQFCGTSILVVDRLFKNVHDFTGLTSHAIAQQHHLR